MKKLLTVTCLAGLLSIPSVVFADEAVPEEAMSDEAMAEEAMPAEPEISPEMQGHIGDSHSGPVWYGSIRVGVASDRGADGVESFGSRWGVQGSSEISEGLTAVYNFEESLDAGIATVEDNGRLSYVGLSGGFGTITAGQVWSASYTTVGSITDKSTAYGNSGTLLRLGNAISYAVSVGNLSMQADAILDSGKADNTVDHLEFGISMDVGDIGKIAFAHTRTEDYTTTTMVDTYTSTSTVMESAVLDSVSIVTGGILTNTLTVSPVVGNKGTLDVSPAVGNKGTLTVGDIGLEGSISLPVTGAAGVLSKITKQKQVTAVECVTDGELTFVAAGSKDADKCDSTAPSTHTVPDLKSPHKLTTSPVTIFDATSTAKIDVEKAVVSGATIKIGTDGKYKAAGTATDVFAGTRWVGDDCPALETPAKAADNNCTQEAYYYVKVTAGDGEVTKKAVDAKNIKDISVSGDAGLSDNLKATGGILDGEISVEGGILSGDIEVKGGVLEGALNITDIDVETETEVTTDPEIKTTTEKDALQTAVSTTVPGSTANFIAGQVTLGGITGYLGYTEVKTNGIDATDSTTHAGIRGSAGDTGVSYFVQLRNKETASPWLVGLSKTLGGGASLNFEYGDEDLADVDHRAGLWLQVDF